MTVLMCTIESFLFFIFCDDHRDKNHDEVINRGEGMSVDRNPVL